MITYRTLHQSQQTKTEPQHHCPWHNSSHIPRPLNMVISLRTAIAHKNKHLFLLNYCGCMAPFWVICYVGKTHYIPKIKATKTSCALCSHMCTLVCIACLCPLTINVKWAHLLRSDAVATFFFTARLCAATIWGRHLESSQTSTTLG